MTKAPAEPGFTPTPTVLIESASVADFLLRHPYFYLNFQFSREFCDPGLNFLGNWMSMVISKSLCFEDDSPTLMQ